MIVELAVETRVSPLDWLAALERDPRLVGTALDVLDKRAKAIEKAARKRR